MNLLQKFIALESRIGKTPLVRISVADFLKRPVPENLNINLWFKAEYNQFSGSVKARAAYSMVSLYLYQMLSESGFLVIGNEIPSYPERMQILKKAAADYNGNLNLKSTLLEATSGNTGIAMAAIGAAAGIPVTLCIPENASPERLMYIKKFGARLVFTSRLDGTDGAEEKAAEMNQSGDYYWTDQYKNPENIAAHYYGTAAEILDAVPEITHFVAGIGTSGTLMGNAKKLRESKPEVRIIALQPDSPMHGIEGWKHLESVSVPDIYNAAMHDETIHINTQVSLDLIKQTAATQGILLSPSGTSNLQGALKTAEKIIEDNEGRSESMNYHIVSIFPDDGSRCSTLISQLPE